MKHEATLWILVSEWCVSGNLNLDKVRKAGGTASSIAVSALVPILLSNAMVGDANASLSKENTGSSSSSGVVSTQPYINSTRINGVK